MTGYVRKDTTNNIADGNVINAADLDSEFDGVQAAFNSSTGHTHDGTASEGAPITKLGPVQDVTVSTTVLGVKTTNTVDLGTSSLKFKDFYLAGAASIGGTLGVTGATTLSAALTYGGVTLSNAVTGTGNMVLSASPTLTGTAGFANITASGTLNVTGITTLTAQPILSSLTASQAVFTDASKGLVSNIITGTGSVVMSASPTLTGTITAAAANFSGAVALNGNATIGDADTDTITQAASYVTGTQLKSAKTATNTLSLAAYDVDGTAYTNLITLTASNTPTLALTSTGVGSMDNIAIGATTASTGAFTTLTSNGATTFTAGTASTTTGTGTLVITGGLGVSGRINAANFDGIVGANTAAAGSFTTLTTSSTVTHSAGTANGVAYLNGSKVLTTGSALGFDGTNLLLGTPSVLTSGKFSLQADLSAVNAMTLRDSGTTYGVSSYYTLYQNSAGSTVGGIGHTAVTSLGINATTDLQFFTAATERMRLDSSGNLGLGVTPSAWSGVKAIEIASAGSGIYSFGATDVRVTGNAYWNGSAYKYGNTNLASMYVQNAGIHYWYNAASGTAGNSITWTQAMTLDASGNLGVGTSSPAGKLHVVGAQNAWSQVIAGNTTSGQSYGMRIQAGTNASDFSLLVRDATNTNTYLAIDGSGNLGLGVTPSAWNTTTAVTALQLPNGSLMTYSNAYGFSNLYLSANAYLNSSGNWIYTKTNSASLYQQTDRQHAWLYANSGTAGNAISFTQAMTLDASGNLGVGTTSPTYKITVKGGNANNLLVDNDGSQYTQLLMQRNSTANTGGDLLVDGTNGLMSLRMLAVGSLRFCTSASAGDGTERARIDSSGNLLVGTTSAVATGKISLVFDGSLVNGIVIKTTASATGSDFMQFYNTSTTLCGRIQQNGTTTVSYTTSSDYRLKENVIPMSGALEKVAQLNPVTYKWKSDGADGQGFIAHELQAVIPDCVVGEKDAVDADGNPVYQGIDTSFLVATLTAAIKEQQALITQLTARITALESA